MNPKQNTVQELLVRAEHAKTQGQDAVARALWLSAIDLDHNNAMIHRELTLSFGEQLDNTPALHHAHMWFLAQPAAPEARWVYGLMLYRANQLDYAIKILTPLSQSHPTWHNINLVMAKIHFTQRTLNLSDFYFKQAVLQTTHSPQEEASTRWEYAMQQLTEGRYADGWDNHEARLKSIGWAQLHLCPLPAPTWAGESLSNKTIVVHGEQGIGDEIMYASMLPDLLAQGAHVILACHAAIANLMRTSFPNILVFEHPRGLDNIEQWQQGTMPDWWYQLLSDGVQIDYQIPMGSLAHLLRRDVNQFTKTPYLVPDINRQTAMENTLRARAQEQGISLKDKQRIALAWCGNLDNPHGRAKSIDLEALDNLGHIANTHNAVFISLQNRQYGDQALEALANDLLPIVDMSPYTDQFTDTLALASTCNHIITIDTSYAHLCGAAGLPTLMLLRRNCDWRWGWTRQDSDWYDSLELIRQDIDGDWEPVIKKTEEKLFKWLTSN